MGTLGKRGESAKQKPVIVFKKTGKIEYEPELREAAAKLVEAVETYTAPKKGEFMHRYKLLEIKDKLKKLL